MSWDQLWDPAVRAPVHNGMARSARMRVEKFKIERRKTWMSMICEGGRDGLWIKILSSCSEKNWIGRDGLFCEKYNGQTWALRLLKRFHSKIRTKVKWHGSGGRKNERLCGMFEMIVVWGSVEDFYWLSPAERKVKIWKAKSMWKGLGQERVVIGLEADNKPVYFHHDPWVSLKADHQRHWVARLDLISKSLNIFHNETRIKVAWT